ncbi:ATP-dependent DNA ligase [Bdellovibrio bacteriovorus]|uniref:DNA ligase (ATP) n=1 Tax=Bdellovibrio bacteriovorus TaxID=959 RepID=A0A150WFE0_BDEBC|nr:ATP-dependent DNA ligase [Bdellovibrio bacteriovorus]KYG61684.1 ATP-dependent DNA ligase [Bdellovibrio bacteriovorus]
MRKFTHLFEELDSTTSTLEKVDALKKYFSKASPDDAMWAVLILTGKISKRILTSRALAVMFLNFTKYPEWLFSECYSQVGDTAETLSLLAKSLRLCSDKPTVHDQQTLTEWLEVRIPALAKIKDAEKQASTLMQWWQSLTMEEVFILNKLMTGALRVGVSEKLVVRALAEVFNIPTDQVAHRLTGDVSPGADSFARLIHPEAQEVNFSQPYPFCLAHPWNERAEKEWNATEWAVEWKFDGIRAQVICREDKIWIWSRGEEKIADTFPDLVEKLALLPNGSVIDGEILIIKDNRILPFQDLQTRLGRKKVSPAMLKEKPVGFIAYDCLEIDGEDIRQKGLQERRMALKKILSPLLSSQVRISEVLDVKNVDDLENWRAKSREHDAEGLMIKRWESPYSVGRKTGNWWKHKVNPLTLDAVLIYAQAGTGRRANLYTDYTFALWKDNGDSKELVPFAKAYSGLDQKEIDELDNWIRRHTKEKFGPVRSLEPFHVFEIGFEGIGPSKRHKSGIAVRFPRILRWRKDKKVTDADSLQTAFELLDAKALPDTEVSP